MEGGGSPEEEADPPAERTTQIRPVCLFCDTQTSFRNTRLLYSHLLRSVHRELRAEHINSRYGTDQWVDCTQCLTPFCGSRGLRAHRCQMSQDSESSRYENRHVGSGNDTRSVRQDEGSGAVAHHSERYRNKWLPISSAVTTCPQLATKTFNWTFTLQSAPGSVQPKQQ